MDAHKRITVCMCVYAHVHICMSVCACTHVCAPVYVCVHLEMPDLSPGMAGFVWDSLWESDTVNLLEVWGEWTTLRSYICKCVPRY